MSSSCKLIKATLSIKNCFIQFFKRKNNIINKKYYYSFFLRNNYIFMMCWTLLHPSHIILLIGVLRHELESMPYCYSTQNHYIYIYLDIISTTIMNALYMFKMLVRMSHHALSNNNNQPSFILVCSQGNFWLQMATEYPIHAYVKHDVGCRGN